MVAMYTFLLVNFRRHTTDSNQRQWSMLLSETHIHILSSTHGSQTHDRQQVSNSTSSQSDQAVRFEMNPAILPETMVAVAGHQILLPAKVFHGHSLCRTASIQILRTVQYSHSIGITIGRAISCRIRRGVDGIAVLFAGAVARGVFGSSRMLTLSRNWSLFCFVSFWKAVEQSRTESGWWDCL